MRNALAIAAALWFQAVPLLAASTDGAETYDLLFKDGTLDNIGSDATLVYRRDVLNILKPETAERDTGSIALQLEPGERMTAKLEFRTDDGYRGLGTFPASVGNPMIMVFYETVVRDMAETAGGSPFYIRNRVKDSLIQDAEIEVGEELVNGRTIQTRTIRLYPFADDPNRERMQGFGDLELSVTMSDELPGWYVELLAEVPGDSAPIYRSLMRFEALETAQ